MAFKNDLKKLNKIFAKEINQVASSESMRKLGKDIAKQIQVRTRQGKGVGVDGGIPGQFTRLKPGTISQRRRFKKAGGLSSKTRPGKSNLTMTGQMLDAMRVRVLGKGKAQIYFRTRRTPIGNEKKIPTNTDLAGYHDRGTSRIPRRPFFRLAAFEIRKFERGIRLKILRLLDAGLTR